MGKTGAYYCTRCEAVLEAGQGMGAASTAEPCPSCGTSLSESLGRRVPERKAAPTVLFRQASSIPRFTLGIGKIDEALSFLSEGQVIGISGYHCQHVVERLCVRAQLPRKHGGLGSRVVMVDGGNSSLPYMFVDFARQYGLSPDSALSGVVCSRAFTVHQLWGLVARDLAGVVARHDARLVVISEMLCMFEDDPFLDREEAKKILEDMISAISQIRDRIVVVSASRPTEYDYIMDRLCDRTMTITREPHSLAVRIGDRTAHVAEPELERVVRG